MTKITLHCAYCGAGKEFDERSFAANSGCVYFCENKDCEDKFACFGGHRRETTEQKDIKITESKILLRAKKWIPFVDMDDEDVKIEVELIERRCPICRKKWLSLWLNDRIVYGGDCTSFRDGRKIESCGCMLDKELEK